MTAPLSVYPSSLPGPKAAPITSTERRAVPQADGDFAMRAFQRDRHAFQDVTFPIFNETQMAVFTAWYENDLTFGAAWFSAVWSLPEGIVSASRRFVGPPNQEYVSWGYWRVSARFEIRGRGEEPLLSPGPSAWNPLDLISANPLPPVLQLTDRNRVATRHTVAIEERFECGVRGSLSHGGTLGERWYFEIVILSVGTGTNQYEIQSSQFGVINDVVTNVLSRPTPVTQSDSSEIDDTPGSVFVLASTRLDGALFVGSGPGNVGTAGFFDSQTGGGDVFGFDWVVGEKITVTKNGIEPKEYFGFVFSGQMFPFFAAGQTLYNSPNPGVTGESARLVTSRTQLTYRPAAARAWG